MPHVYFVIDGLLQLCIKDIMGFGVMMTPALAIDGKVVAAGKVLNPDDIRL